MILRIRDEYIKLGQALKAAGVSDSGVEAKERILAGEVLVNGEVCLQRGKKCYEGDVISLEEETITIAGSEDL